jgi:isopenicillin N synthase-like dioxygenase
MAPSAQFPVLDFSKYQTDAEDFARKLYEASSSWGFFILTGTDLEGVDELFDLVSIWLG